MEIKFSVNCQAVNAVCTTLESEGIEFNRIANIFTCTEIDHDLVDFLRNDNTIRLKDVVEKPQAESKEIYHEKFPILVDLVNAGMHVYMHGPAGTGKSHIAKQVAEFLGKAYIPDTTPLNEYSLIGFVDANGVFHETPFYKACKYGGLYAPDELDGMPASAGLVYNQSLANGCMTFANGELVYLHKDFVFMASGNTVGNGMSADGYIRNTLDPATLDRFFDVRIDYSEELELMMADGNKELVEFAHELRKAFGKCHLNHIVSYRALKRAATLINMGWDTKDVLAYSFKLDADHVGNNNLQQVYWKMDLYGNKYQSAFGEMV